MQPHIMTVVRLRYLFLPEDSSQAPTPDAGQQVPGGVTWAGFMKSTLWIFFSILASLLLARLS